MALDKSLTTNTGVTVKYWRIVQINQNSDRQDCIVDLAGYVDELTRRDGKYPVVSNTFCFKPDDHPLSEIDPAVVDETLLSDWTDFLKHLCYVHIKTLVDVAKNKSDELTRNETIALQFDGAEDVI